MSTMKSQRHMIVWDSRFVAEIFKCIFLNEKFGILIDISQKYVLKGPVHVVAWHQTGPYLNQC